MENDKEPLQMDAMEGINKEEIAMAKKVIKKADLRDNERLIEIGKGKNKHQFIQVLLPVRQAIQLRNQWVDDKGSVDEVKMYDLILENCFDEEYNMDDFTSVALVDELTMLAFHNQWADTGK